MMQAETVRVQHRDEADAPRAEAYMLLSSLLAAPPGGEFLSRLAALRPDVASPWGRCLSELAEAAAAMTPDGVEREFNCLFIGVDRGELLPYASWYLTGFLQDRPLVALRDEMARLGIARTAGVAEPEDHISGVLEIMAGLLAARFPAAPPGAANAFFSRHIRPWAPRFFADLEQAQNAAFYRSVAGCGRFLMEIEDESGAAIHTGSGRGTGKE